MNNYQLVLPEILIKSVLSLYHESTLAGHSGIQNTLDLVSEQYFFHQMSQKVTNFVRSCHECQSRKNTTLKTKGNVTAFPTPCAPFEVWEMDLQYGPVPMSRSGNAYIFTAIDLHSKYMFAEAIPNTDPLTVANALFKLVTQFGVCKTIVTDQGSEFIGKCFKEVCRLLDIVQEYTPSFTHHCLGACERPHRTLSERITLYLVKGKPWEDILYGVVFSINNTSNSTTKFSPFEVVYGTRPKFPLSVHIKDTDFTSLSKDCHEYIRQHVEKLNIIRRQVETNIVTSQSKMLDRVNSDKIPTNFNVSDYVYFLKEPTGQGQKFKNKFAGPYVVSDIHSPHMYKLKDPCTGKLFSQPIHVNRIKSAYMRVPNPSNYFLDQVITQQPVEHISSDIEHQSESDKSPSAQNNSNESEHEQTDKSVNEELSDRGRP